MSFIIHRKPPYRIFVEVGHGKAMAHVAELPGCFTVGTDASRAVAAMPRAIFDFLAWLRSYREPLVPEASVSRPSMADLFVEEIRRGGAPSAAGSKAAIFEFDKAAWDDAKLERSLRWLGYSRSSLLTRVRGLDDAELKAKLVAPGRSAWDTLWHVANAEYDYINQVVGPLDGLEPVTETQPLDVHQRLADIREIFVRRARGMPIDRRDEVIYPAWTPRTDEPWTLAKALRRAIEHEREHTLEL